MSMQPGAPSALPDPPAIDPILKSWITTALAAGAASVAEYAATKGIIPKADVGDFSNQLVALAFGAGFFLLAWWKGRQHTQPALIAAVNDANNGVKVVANTVQAPTVTAPIPALMAPTPTK